MLVPTRRNRSDQFIQSTALVNNRLIHLDCLRGLAALMVCIEHLRAFVMIPYNQVKDPGILVRIFYLATGLGHQAVMIFFVLSGFLVGGSVIAAQQKNKWTWRSYFMRRLSRLWVVLIPALLLTLFWDHQGRQLAPEAYNGVYRDHYCSGPATDSPADLRPMTFLGNVFFLQTIALPCLGTNGPLWSLANEFWYYLLFPCLLFACVAHGRWLERMLCLAVAGVVLAWLPSFILEGGIIWLMGAAAFFVTQKPLVRKWAIRSIWLAGSGALALGLLVLSRTRQPIPGEDLLLGGAFAILVIGLAVRPNPTGIYASIAAGASEFSYTLYLVHFPLLAFFFFVVFQGRQIPPNLYSGILFLVWLLVIIIYAAVLWWVFERNTDRVRKRLEANLPWRASGNAIEWKK